MSETEKAPPLATAACAARSRLYKIGQTRFGQAVGALSFSRSRLTRGIAGIAGRLAFGLQDDITGGLLGDFCIAGGLVGGLTGGLLGDLCISGGLFGGLTGNARQPGILALGNARIAGDVDCVPGGLPFGECRVVRPRFRAKLVQFRFLRARRCTQSVVKTRPF